MESSGTTRVRAQGPWPQARLAVAEPEILVDHLPMLLAPFPSSCGGFQKRGLFPVLLNVQLQARPGVSCSPSEGERKDCADLGWALGHRGHRRATEPGPVPSPMPVCLRVPGS